MGNRLGGYDRKAIEDGIRDKRTQELLWSENMMLHSHAEDDNAGNDNNYNDENGAENDYDNGNSAQLVKKKAQPSGPGWEDEWDKARISLPPFSSLPWVDRQLVKEWRTCGYLTYSHNRGEEEQERQQQRQQRQQYDTEHDGTDPQLSSSPDDLEEEDFEQARTLLPQPIQKPPWENASSCYACRKIFGSILRHHCRLCGRSYCQAHSRWSHRLPHLGYSPDVPERVCAPCKQVLESQNLAERIAWRMARCRDYLSGTDLCPYFETGMDTVEDAAARLTKAAIHMAKSIPLGAQATVAVETLDVLRKHGLKGVYGLILRKEFMAAADLLCKVSFIPVIALLPLNKLPTDLLCFAR